MPSTIAFNTYNIKNIYRIKKPQKGKGLVCVRVNVEHIGIFIFNEYFRQNICIEGTAIFLLTIRCGLHIL